jgi:hypothetical protein
LAAGGGALSLANDNDGVFLPLANVLFPSPSFE